MGKLLFLILALNVVSFAALSQDKIYRQNGKVVEAKIIEVGSAEIKYREFKDPDGPIYVLETDRIKKIVYANGKEQKFGDDFKDPERYAGQRNKAIKLNFLSALYGYTEFGFEKSTGVGMGYELSAGIIGLGKSDIIDVFDYQMTTVRKQQLGLFFSGGYKFGKLPDFILFGRSRMSHLMQGTYIKPVMYLGFYKENRIVEKSNNNLEVGKQNVIFGAAQIEIGRQWVLGDKFLLDIYEGLGYGFDNKKDSYQSFNNGSIFDNTTAYNYANVRLGRSPSLSYSFGIKLGLLIK
jgi:hypothetical protein